MRLARSISIVAAVLLAALVVGGGPALAQDSQFVHEMLDQHNKLRARHGSPPLTLDPALNDKARKSAKYYADKRTLDHSSPYKDQAGESLMFVYDRQSSESGASVTDRWYREVKDYDFSKPGFSQKTGHFTQMIWKSTKRLGIGTATSDGRMYIVALYDPPGNVLVGYPPRADEFVKNVLPQG